MSEDLDRTQEAEETTEEEQAEPESTEEESTETEQPEPEEDEGPDLFSMSDDEYMDFIAKNSAPKQDKKEKQPPVEKETSDEPEPAKETKQEPKQDAKQEEIDYKAFYEQVMAPIVSNGKEVKPTTLKDIRNLMHMGTDYTRKTQQIAPIRRIAETIRNAKIGDDDLNNLINAYNGDKEAIKRIIKRNNINVMDIDVDEEAKDYQPANNIASDRQLEFAEILDEIQPSIQRIKSILQDTWDNKSTEIITRDPKILKGLHEELAMGRFDLIQSVLDEQRALGKFRGIPDVQAYAMIAKAHDDYEREKAQHKQSKQEDTSAKPNKAKAAPTRKSPTQKTTKKFNDFDLADMSDDEFLKL